MMIIVALISILVQLAVPNYKDRMVKTHRLGAKTTLMQAQISLEDCYLFKMNYETCEIVPASDDYTLSLNATAHAFTLLLQPKPGTLSAQDTQCYRWEVDHKHQWAVFSFSGTNETAVCF